MGLTVNCTCDGCGADITTRTNCEDYRLKLASEDKPGHGSGFYTAMAIYPPIDRTHYFCALRCLDRWSDHRRHIDAAMHEFWEKWKTDHGQRFGNSISYPGPPNDVRKAALETAKAEADEKFPLNKSARVGN